MMALPTSVDRLACARALPLGGVLLPRARVWEMCERVLSLGECALRVGYTSVW